MPSTENCRSASGRQLLDAARRATKARGCSVRSLRWTNCTDDVAMAFSNPLLKRDSIDVDGITNPSSPTRHPRAALARAKPVVDAGPGDTAVSIDICRPRLKSSRTDERRVGREG